MANPERGEVALTVVGADGQTKEYTLKLTMNAAVTLQRRTKKSVAEILQFAEKLDFEAIRDMAFMLLQKYHAKEITTPEQAGDLLDAAGGVGPFFEAFRQLLDVNVAPTEEGSANPPVAQPTTGGSSISTPDVVN